MDIVLFIVNAVEEHARMEEPEHAFGDMAAIISAAWDIMDQKGRERFLKDPRILSVFHSAGIINDDNPRNIYGFGRVGVASRGEYPCEACKDVCIDGDTRCANESICYAWRLYQSHQDCVSMRMRLPARLWRRM